MVRQMNTRLPAFYLLASALLVSGCVAGERRHVTVQRQWPASAIERVELRGVNGDLHVDAVDVPEVELVAEIRSRGMAPGAGENQGYFQTELSGNTLRIEQKRHGRRGFPFRMGTKLEIDYTLRVPRQVALDLTTVNGRIATRGTAGGTTLKSVNGAIDAEVGAGDFRAQTVNGRIRASFVGDFRGAQLKTVNGGVQAILPTSASFTCDLSQVNGDFEATFPLSIHSHPGRRRVSGEVNGGRYELKITTVNGNVRVQHAEPPPVPPAPAIPAAPALPPPPVS
jgi:hypothetical protein